MILGKTCTAKSVTWRCLQGAMGKLKAANKPGFNKVEIYPINPKALNLAELYGEFNLTTNEWLDGVISAVMRHTCQGRILFYIFFRLKKPDALTNPIRKSCWIRH